MKRTPRELNRLASAPFFSDGKANAIIEKAHLCFARHDMRGYGTLCWQLRRMGSAEIDRLKAEFSARDAAANPPSATDLEAAARYQTLHGRARKSFGYRHRESLDRAGSRWSMSGTGFRASDEACKIVWGI